MIIGKLIPAGAGLDAYRELAEQVVPDAAPAAAEEPAAPADPEEMAQDDFLPQTDLPREGAAGLNL